MYVLARVLAYVCVCIAQGCYNRILYDKAFNMSKCDTTSSAKKFQYLARIKQTSLQTHSARAKICQLSKTATEIAVRRRLFRYRVARMVANCTYDNMRKAIRIYCKFYNNMRKGVKCNSVQILTEHYKRIHVYS